MSPTIAEFSIGLVVAGLAFYWGVKVAPVLIRAFQDWLKRNKQEAQSLDPNPPSVIDGEVTRRSSTGPKSLP